MLLDSSTGEINKVTSFIQVLLESDSATEVCRKIVHLGSGSVSLVGCEILRIEASSLLSSLGSYGIRPDLTDCSVFSDCIAGQTARTNSLTLAPFDAATSISNGSLTPRSVVALPLAEGVVPLGVMVLTSSKELSDFPMQPETLEAISRLGALFLKQNGFSQPSSVSATGADQLTERQVVILGYMSEGMTNAQIAKELLLSESSIRQETVKIYRALGVNNRDAAARQAKGLGLISPPPRRPAA